MVYLRVAVLSLLFCGGVGGESPHVFREGDRVANTKLGLQFTGTIIKMVPTGSAHHQALLQEVQGWKGDYSHADKFPIALIYLDEPVTRWKPGEAPRGEANPLVFLTALTILDLKLAEKKGKEGDLDWFVRRVRPGLR